MRVLTSHRNTSSLHPGEILPPLTPEGARQTHPRRRVFRHMLWLCLLLACTGTSWFAFQVFLVPQPEEFQPNWQDARWVQANDATAPIAYFRYAVQFDKPPDNTFITVTANQVFRLYTNGIYIGSNTMDFVQGNTRQTYMFDLDASLVAGVNVIGLRVANVDKGTPQVRATIDAQWGQQTYYYSTGKGSWQATAQTALVHPRAEQSSYAWTTRLFDASRWPQAQGVAQPPRSSLLMVNPQIYEQPMPAHWLSVGSGNGHEGYFVRSFALPAGFTNALLRIVATGEADIFINDHLYMQWNGQVNVPQINVVNYLNDNGEPAPYRNGLMLGVYDVSSYLHAGNNTIAVHVLAPGTMTAKTGLDTLKSALSLDILVGANGTYSNPFTSDVGWYTSSQPVTGWTRASNATFGWAPPDAVGRPGASRTFYLPDSNTPRNVQVIPPTLIGEIIAYSSIAVLVFWLVSALILLRRYYPSRRAALEATSLVWFPALACEAVLVTLTREPLMPQPFPYTWQWGMVLLALLGLSTLALWWHARRTFLQRQQQAAQETASVSAYMHDRVYPRQRDQMPQTLLQHIQRWLRHNWAILPVILLTIPMVCYDPTYEPFWQDKLSSYYAALHIMSSGYPAFPSGFTYPKGELFSYILALLMFIFGTKSLLVPRLISMVCFLASLPILYVVGTKLFNRKVAWFATAMLAFSPYTMIWSRQTRMYEMAQLMVILVLYTFYRALQHQDKIRPICIASVCLIIAYFSHEEVFVILPALLVCVLVSSREGAYGFPAVLRNKHWWVATLIGSTFIMAQLSVVFLTHPLKLGSDQSQRPQIQLTADNVSYYFNLLFTTRPMKNSPSPWLAMPPFIGLNSLLAVLGCVFAFWRKDKRARYCALFLVSSTITLVFVFTMQADRYYYPLLPVYYLLGAYTFWKILAAFWGFARPYLTRPCTCPALIGHRLTPIMRSMLAGTVAFLCGCILITPMLPLSNFNLFVSRTLGLSYHQHYGDYNNVANYVHAHMQKGDLVVTIAPAVIVLYYVGQVDDFFSIDRALFLFERNGQIVETTSGSHPLLSEDDFQAVLAKHNRIWLISDNGGYQGGVTKNARFTFPPPDFRLVYEGYGSSVYFRSANG